jgi:hypothetical protein
MSTRSRNFRDRFSLPLSDEAVSAQRFYRFLEDSPETAYLRQQRGSRRLHADATARGIHCDGTGVGAIRPIRPCDRTANYRRCCRGHSQRSSHDWGAFCHRLEPMQIMQLEVFQERAERSRSEVAEIDWGTLRARFEADRSAPYGAFSAPISFESGLHFCLEMRTLTNCDTGSICSSGQSYPSMIVDHCGPHGAP